jgi:hypothetical protein
LSGRISSKYLREKLIPKMQEMLEPKQNLKRRKRGVEMLGLVAQV